MDNKIAARQHYRILNLIEENPEMSQRQLAEAMGISLGKLNYVLRALVKKGMVKGRNFKHRKNKATYAYLLTPKGIEEKARATLHFFRRVEEEYEMLKREVETLSQSTSSKLSPLMALSLEDNVPHDRD